MLRMHGVTLGYSELEDREPSTGRARGKLRAGTGYELVQPIFRLYAEAVPPGSPPADDVKLARYRAARDRLNLELVDAGGRVIEASAIHVEDYTVERGAGSLEIEALISDAAFWGR
jgi:hypothetical protein